MCVATVGQQGQRLGQLVVQQLEQLVELAEQLVELVKLFADAAADVAGRTEVKARVKIRQPKELEVLLIAICYWDSLKSQTFLQCVVGA